MDKKVKLSLIGLIVLGITISFYFTPHIAVYNMKKAAENKDAKALSDYVDYQSLRESLKANFHASMSNEVVNSNDVNPFAAFGAVLTSTLINRMVDAFVTPESLAMMMKGDKPNLNKDSITRKEKLSSDDSNKDISKLYEGLNNFVVKVKEKESSEEPVEFIFKRHGLISWKLSELRLPLPNRVNTQKKEVEELAKEGLKNELIEPKQEEAQIENLHEEEVMNKEFDTDQQEETQVDNEPTQEEEPYYKVTMKSGRLTTWNAYVEQNDQYCINEGSDESLICFPKSIVKTIEKVE